MSSFGSNVGYIDDLYLQFLENPNSVSEAWRDFFEDYEGPAVTTAGPEIAPAENAPLAAAAASPTPPPAPVTVETVPSQPATEYETLVGPPARIVDNMEASLGVPTATSVRTLPVKLLEENRRLINQHQHTVAGSKVSFTHIIAWAIIHALEEQPALNCGYEERDGKPHRVRRGGINLGLAIDVEKRGKRMLLVPNLKNAAQYDFLGFLNAYNEIVFKARKGRLTVDDFQETSVTITNPGMIGTVLSVPRLMAGQGTIIGIGSIGFPLSVPA